MSVIYSDAWYQDMRNLIAGSERFRELAPRGRLAMALEVMGDGTSPYLAPDEAIHYLIVLDDGAIAAYEHLDGRHDGTGLHFRFTAPATVWEEIAAAHTDPITAGLRGKIKIRGDMRVLMQNADAVKVLVELYGQQVYTEWPEGAPPYAPSRAAAESSTS